MMGDRFSQLVAAEDLAATRELLERDPDLAHRLRSVALEKAGALSGFYHHNVRVGNLMCRFPAAGADNLDRRTYEENDVLRAIQPYLGRKASHLVYEGQGWSVHAYEEGRVLHELSPPGRPVPRLVLDDTVDLFRRLTDVPLGDMRLPPWWPEDGDSVGFGLRRAIQASVAQWKSTRWFGREFDLLGLPLQPHRAMVGRLTKLTPRPFQLLHNDMHRGNIIVRPDGHAVFVDWELATIGDWVYEVATHLHLMRYTEGDRQYLLERCLERMPPASTEGWQADLETYLDLNRIQSAVNDTVRVIHKIRKERLSPAEKGEMVLALTGTLNTAGRIWGMEKVLSPDEVAAAVQAGVVGE
ncbi:phosphotransferase family protein [Actinomadura verrucosospora]|uniref:phosphotransferase family protein n=1 Tax=Actinomadura TaxID=1988 RepID=UPI0031E9BEFB